MQEEGLKKVTKNTKEMPNGVILAKQNLFNSLQKLEKEINQKLTLLLKPIAEKLEE